MKPFSCATTCSASSAPPRSRVNPSAATWTEGKATSVCRRPPHGRPDVRRELAELTSSADLKGRNQRRRALIAATGAVQESRR